MFFIFLAYFTLYNGLQFHPSHWNWFKWILFNGWVISHGVYVPQLPYPFICWWASRLLPCPGYYTVLRWTLECTCLFQFWFPWCVCPEVGLLGSMAVLFYCHMLLIIVSYNSLYFFIVCCNLFFMSNFADLILFFSWWVWLKACQFSLSSQRNNF